ncbi:hypothetical protein [Pseudobacteriovorax antillogorgiicola]|uniref:hypothetical protein n=1 Tax=Pseudobacteriovorax antillogorgiicola TaxID=1513793 RepID=UPI00135635E1|nr:hypothetical protein [Pseudobacteriovorax antillogorgiicola]
MTPMELSENYSDVKVYTVLKYPIRSESLMLAILGLSQQSSDQSWTLRQMQRNKHLSLK